jgi:hypothetical protein
LTSSGSGLEPPALPKPLVETWQAGVPWLRCHHVELGASEFNPGLGGGRFHPFAGRDGRVVPSLYGASTLDGALSETIFHAVPLRGPARAIRRSSLRPMVVSTLVARRDLRLAQLHGHGLRRFGVSRRDLIDCEADQYVTTRRWARALHGSAAHVDGLVWISRLHDTARSLMLFGDRVMRRDLMVSEAPQPLYFPPGFDDVQRAAEEADITIIE